jgi:hypothetical protein
VVFFAGQDWWYHNRAHSDIQLALRVARERPVLFINSIGTRMPRRGRSTKVLTRLVNKARSVARLARRPVPGLPGFVVYSPLGLPAYGSALGRRVNTALLRMQIGALSRWLRFREPDIVVTPPTAWEVARRMRRRRLAFNRSDKHSAWAEVDADYLRGLERELLRGADVVLYVSSALQAEDRPEVGDRAVFLDHGVDLDLFDPDGPVAGELAGISRPVVGYFGALRDSTVDGALLERVASEVPEASLVVIGPIMMPVEGLCDRPNVHLMGTRAHEDVPAFGRGFDVAIMPWLDNEWIRVANPIKMKEYLALGLRTVTTDFPEAHRYADVVEIASSSDDFVARVRKAAAEADSPAAVAKRRAAVETDSWDVRAALLLDVLQRSGRLGTPGRVLSGPPSVAEMGRDKGMAL